MSPIYEINQSEYYYMLLNLGICIHTSVSVNTRISIYFDRMRGHVRVLYWFNEV